MKFKTLFKNIDLEDITLNVALILLLPFMLAVSLGFLIGETITKILTYITNILKS